MQADFEGTIATEAYVEEKVLQAGGNVVISVTMAVWMASG